jgi:hypothetical protein
VLYLKIVGYCTLWTIAFALLFAICMIIKEGHIGPDGATNNDVVAGQGSDTVVDHAVGQTSASAPAPKPTSRAALPSV